MFKIESVRIVAALFDVVHAASYILLLQTDFVSLSRCDQARPGMPNGVLKALISKKLVKV